VPESPARSSSRPHHSAANRTFDQAIANTIGMQTRLKSLHLGVASMDTSDADFGAVAKSISHNGPNSPNLPEYDPVSLYNRFFGPGSNAGNGGMADVTLAKRKSVLDVVSEDACSLQKRLGTRDRQRLEQHLKGITELERQLTVMPPTVSNRCRAPTKPTSSYPAIDQQQIQWDALDSVQRELLVMALVCDQTRVFTYRFSPANDYTIYPGFPPFKIDPNSTDTGTSMHAMTHWQPGDQPGVQTCVRFVMTKLAALLERLKATPEGGGSVLDNCAILAFTEHTEGRTHNSTQQPGIPILIAGRAGGRLKYPGVLYKSPLMGDRPSEQKGRNVSCVPLTLMQALNTGIRSWGNAEGQATRVISELLA
jgi:hypothetical protein